ncbi:MAG: hypothetical protein OEY86_00895 [Nitrospira sp.]|nr:hypothetical protein [Nitrospira sp.]
MKKILSSAIILAFLTGVSPSYAQLIQGGSSGSGGVTTIGTGDELPSTCTPGDLSANGLFLDTDDGAFYFCDTTDNFVLLLSTTPGLSSVLAVDRIDGDAINESTAFTTGSAAADSYAVTFYDSTSGITIATCKISGTLHNCHKVIKVIAGKKFQITDASDVAMINFEPNAATPKERYAVGALKPLKSVYLSARALEGDGTNCPARPTVVTISNVVVPTFICTENNSSRLRFAIPMRSNWDAGVIYIRPYYSQTADDTGSVALEVAAACRAPGTAFNGTYGTEVEVDDAVLAGSGAIEATLSAAVTPNGTCAAGDWLFGYIDVDATDDPTTAAATLHFIGTDLLYSESSLSH